MRDKILTTCELQKIRVRDNGEKLIALRNENSQILCEYRRKNSGVQDILIRESLVDKLNRVQSRLKQQHSNVQLLVVEGYRSSEYQERYYLQELFLQSRANPEFNFDQMLEHIHQFVALPSVAGHPTGGAVDLTLALNGSEISMGAAIADFSCPEMLPTFSASVAAEQAYWRLMLHDVMLAESFAPFYGEWWHYSFGDREWAAFYDLPEALYAPLYNI